MRVMDVAIGEIKGTFGIYSDYIGTEKGVIQMGETGILIKTNDEGSMVVPFNYIQSIEKKGGMSLGKVQVTMAFMDVMGDRHELVFTISDMKLAELKRACQK